MSYKNRGVVPHINRRKSLASSSSSHSRGELDDQSVSLLGNKTRSNRNSELLCVPAEHVGVMDPKNEIEYFFAGYSTKELRSSSSLKTAISETVANDFYWIQQILKFNAFFFLIEVIWAEFIDSGGLRNDCFFQFCSVIVASINCFFEYIKQKRRSSANTWDFLGSLPVITYLITRQVVAFRDTTSMLSHNRVHQFKIDGLAMFSFLLLYSINNLQMIRAYYAQEHRSFGSVAKVLFPAKICGTERGARLLYTRNEFGGQESRLIISFAWLVTLSDILGYAFHCLMWTCITIGYGEVQFVAHYVVLGHTFFISLLILLVLYDQYSIIRHKGGDEEEQENGSIWSSFSACWCCARRRARGYGNEMTRVDKLVGGNRLIY